jgi:hypothetical protein
MYTSQLDAYLINTIGMKEGYETLLKYVLSDPNGKLDEDVVRENNKNGWPIVDLLRAAATLEDDPMCRASNHFYNPLAPAWTDAGLSDSGYGLLHLTCSDWKLWQSNVVWATGFEDKEGTNRFGYDNLPEGEAYYNWDTARARYHAALTATDEAARQEEFARTFLALGHVGHLLEDMAVPAHTRNDMKGHLSFLGVQGFNITQWYGNLFEYYVSLNPDIVTEYAAKTAADYMPAFSRLSDFWDTDTYDGQNPSVTVATTNIGLAEYANANFFSDDTLNMSATPVEGEYPYPNRASTSLDTILQGLVEPMAVMAEDGKEDRVFYVSKIADGEEIEHFLVAKYHVYSQLNKNGTLDVDDGNFYRDEQCHADYAKKLVPRAVGYTAALVDYFFRGTIEIDRPSEGAYGVIDGTASPQEFTLIKARVRNTSIDASGALEPTSGGTLRAAARFKPRADYQPDLSNEPKHYWSDDQEAADAAVGYAYAISTPVAADALASGAWETFQFDFSQTPIPVGVSDLSLFVVYEGTLGSEQDTGVAVGSKDLSEPTQFVLWNMTDMYSFNQAYGTFATNSISPIADIPAALNAPPSGDVSLAIYFVNSPDRLESYEGLGDKVGDLAVSASGLGVNEYGRIIALFDDAATYNYTYIEAAWSGTLIKEVKSFVPALLSDGYYYPPVREMDGLRYHYHRAAHTCYPNPDGSALCYEPESGSVRENRTFTPASVSVLFGQ